MRPTFVLGAALLSTALVAGGCAGAGKDKSDADLTADLATALVAADPELSDDAATCWAEVIVEEVGAARLRDLDLTSDTPPAGLEDDFARAGVAARTTCDLDP